MSMKSSVRVCTDGPQEELDLVLLDHPQLVSKYRLVYQKLWFSQDNTLIPSFAFWMRYLQIFGSAEN